MNIYKMSARSVVYLFSFIFFIIIVFFIIKTIIEKDVINRFELIKSHPLIGIDNTYNIVDLLYVTELIRDGRVDAGDAYLPPKKMCTLSVFKINDYSVVSIDNYKDYLDKKMNDSYDFLINNKEYQDIHNYIRKIKQDGWILLNRKSTKKIWFNSDFFEENKYCIDFIMNKENLERSSYKHGYPVLNQYDIVDDKYPFFGVNKKDIFNIFSAKDTYAYSPFILYENGYNFMNKKLRINQVVINHRLQRLIIISTLNSGL